MSRTLLVLDLDETLIYADERPLARAEDFRVPPYFVYLRPGLNEFLCTVAEHFDLAVWTSSSPAYARAVCSGVFGERFPLAFVWASDRCTPTRDFENDCWAQAKRLSKLKRRGCALERVLVVDDSPEKHARNYGNLVRVAPFLGDPGDDDLFHLARYLPTLATVANVRSIEKRRWRQRVDSEPVRREDPARVIGP
jgi:carboxy-terminal domain RNA polymerase II polypeptide A small phosphatase